MDTHPLTNTEGDMGSKIRGALVLEELCKDTLPDLFLLCAALPSRGDMARTVAHTSADAFSDTFVNSNRLPPGCQSVALNRDFWPDGRLKAILLPSNKMPATMETPRIVF